MLQITSKDWLINQKVLPDKESREYDDFYEYHKKLCQNGCTIDGVFIPGTLYWHLNMWNTEVDYIDEYNRVQQKYANPLLRDNEWIIFNEIERAHREQKGLAIGGSRRLGKDLLNSSKIYTSEGPIEIGNAKVGQKIYDREGKLTTIIGVYPQGIRPVYKVTLRDGREIFCGLTHEWSVIEKASKKIPGTRKSQHYYREVVKTTKEILDSGITQSRIHNGYKDNKTHNIFEAKYWIANNQAVPYSHRDLPIDPYFLGLWLSDGSERDTGITSADEEIVQYVYEHAKNLNLNIRVSEKKNQSNKANTYYSTTGKIFGNKDSNILLTNLRNLNLLLNKHIPNIYKYSSIDQRLELLRGLMDGDGWVTKKDGNIGYCCTNKQLANDFFELCRSLGISLSKKESRAKLKGKDCGPCWKFNLFTELPIFKLSRKLQYIRRGVPGKQPKMNKTAIINIEYVYDAETTCISVNNENKLFLTDNYTPTHNSVFISSYIGYGATFDEHSQNIVSGLNSADIKVTTDKIDKGLNNIPEYYRWDRIEDNWKSQVTLGVKTKSGRRIPFSSILIRNLDNGSNQEAIAGTKPRRLVIEEGAKGAFLAGLQAAIPGFTTPFGWTCSPLVIFTGGDADAFHDAQELFFAGGAYNFLEYPDLKVPNRKHGLFLGAKYRQEAKEESTLGKYLNKEDSYALNQIPMLVSNEEKARDITTKDLEKRKQSGDQWGYLKEKMYFPFEVDDVFLNLTANIFNVEAAKIQQQKLRDNSIEGSHVELYHDGERIRHKFSDKRPVSRYPHKSGDNKDAPIVMWEPPIENAPFGLYLAGVDSYRFGEAGYSDSLGAVYIYKRMHSIADEKFQDMFVASYVARPESKEHWYEQARMLIKYYNARALVENDEMSFIEYMIAKGDAQYLEPTPAFLTDFISYNSTTLKRQYGLSRGPERIRNWLNSALKTYLDEVIRVDKDENGSVIREITGVSRIRDPMLLEEIIKYHDKINADRIVAASLAIGFAQKLDPIIGKVQKEVDPRIASLYGKKKESDKLFNKTSSLFRVRKDKLFR